jgi:hypothetical protein
LETPLPLTKLLVVNSTWVLRRLAVAMSDPSLPSGPPPEGVGPPPAPDPAHAPSKVWATSLPLGTKTIQPISVKKPQVSYRPPDNTAKIANIKTTPLTTSHAAVYLDTEVGLLQMPSPAKMTYAVSPSCRRAVSDPTPKLTAKYVVTLIGDAFVREIRALAAERRQELQEMQAEYDIQHHQELQATQDYYLERAVQQRQFQQDLDKIKRNQQFLQTLIESKILDTLATPLPHTMRDSTNSIPPPVPAHPSSETNIHCSSPSYGPSDDGSPTKFSDSVVSLNVNRAIRSNHTKNGNLQLSEPHPFSETTPMRLMTPPTTDPHRSVHANLSTCQDNSNDSCTAPVPPTTILLPTKPQPHSSANANPAECPSNPDDSSTNPFAETTPIPLTILPPTDPYRFIHDNPSKCQNFGDNSSPAEFSNTNPSPPTVPSPTKPHHSAHKTPSKCQENPDDSSTAPSFPHCVFQASRTVINNKNMISMSRAPNHALCFKPHICRVSNSRVQHRMSLHSRPRLPNPMNHEFPALASLCTKVTILSQQRLTLILDLFPDHPG